MRLRHATTILSLLLIAVAVGSLFVRGLNFGLDFTGGTLVEVSFDEPVAPQEVRVRLDAAGYPDLVVQNFGTPRDLLVRVPPDVVGDEARVGDALVAVLRKEYGEGVTLNRSEFVGPAVGEQLREQGGLAMLTALALVMVYIMFRFTGKFAIGAVAALGHDVIITLGAFSLFQWSFDLPSMAAVLAVIGYSLNDTIVVYDRIRENFRRVRRGTTTEIINTSLSQTLGRTTATSGTTLLVVVALLVFGGQLIEGFAEALIVGIVIGTYSSIYVAANLLISMKLAREDLILPEKEGADQETIG
ncbi:MAG TPA: protein translocase subunit SecF [Pseudomonadales bacterium]|nr:protein translocase subunit SecF [Pseudomonadales bacterium]